MGHQEQVSVTEDKVAKHLYTCKINWKKTKRKVRVHQKSARTARMGFSDPTDCTVLRKVLSNSMDSTIPEEHGHNPMQANGL